MLEIENELREDELWGDGPVSQVPASAVQAPVLASQHSANKRRKLQVT